MAQNKLSDLNNHLFKVMEDLTNPEIDTKGHPVEDLDETVKKAMAVAKVGQVIVNNAKLQLTAMQLVASGRMIETELPETITYNKKQLKK